MTSCVGTTGEHACPVFEEKMRFLALSQVDSRVPRWEDIYHPDWTWYWVMTPESRRAYVAELQRVVDLDEAEAEAKRMERKQRKAARKKPRKPGVKLAWKKSAKKGT